jgi:hypothetical protein
MLLAGSLSVYAQAQDRRPEQPDGKANQQQAPSGSTQNQGQSDGKAERPAGADRVQGGQAEKREDTGKQTGQTNQRENTGNQAGQQNERGGNQAADRDDRKEGGSADNKNASDRNQNSASDKDAQRAEKSGNGGGKAKQREASRKLQPQQKTVIKQTIVKRNVRPARINFSINVGTVVPRDVVLYDLPPLIIEVAPDYNGYKYILADDDTILVIDPETWEIVDVINV